MQVSNWLLRLLKIKDLLQGEISFIADENIPVGLIKSLFNEGFDIVRVKLRSKDPKIFERAKSEQRVILTRDKDFLNKDKFPPKESFGIIFFDINPPLIDSLQYSLNKLFKKIKPSEFKGCLTCRISYPKLDR